MVWICHRIVLREEGEHLQWSGVHWILSSQLWTWSSLSMVPFFQRFMNLWTIFTLYSFFHLSTAELMWGYIFIFYSNSLINPWCHNGAHMEQKNKKSSLFWQHECPTALTWDLQLITECVRFESTQPGRVFLKVPWFLLKTTHGCCQFVHLLQKAFILPLLKKLAAVRSQQLLHIFSKLLLNRRKKDGKMSFVQYIREFVIKQG